MPQVSVIIPTYNAARYLGDAIDSVLAQTYNEFEVVVVDDGSTDETPTVVNKYDSRVRYLSQQNAGVAVARNRGISESRAKYVAFLDADDTWFPDKLERQMGLLAQSTAERVCYSAFLEVNQNLSPVGVRRSLRYSNAFEDLLLRGNVIGSICTVVAERDLFEKLGGFDPSLSQCADWDMWVRIGAETEFLYLDDVLVTYRQHETNMSRNAALLETDSLRVLDKGFAMDGLPESLTKQRAKAYARNYMVLAATYFHAGMYLDFLRCAGKSVSLDHRQIGRLSGFPARAISRKVEGR